ncbi:MAG: glycosyltransferase, partial [Spirochaetota bacterium]|nr:glycosyltransferase [Spirochaetota bacterium]
MPTLTVITPSFNQGAFIKRTIDSVLEQNVGSLEYIVMDGGSKDNTLDVLKSYGDKITWFSEPDKGQADAVNKGLKLAKGEIIGWLNSDDIYYPHALKKVLEIFERNPEIQVVYGMADHIDINDEWIEAYPTEPWNYELL